MARYLTPRWIAAHVFVVVVVAVCTALGFWQLRRLDERGAVNDRIEERRSDRSTPLAAPGQVPPDELVYRSAEVRGSYDVEREVLLAGRSLEGRPGHHVLTPLVTAAGWGVLVERGWVPYELDRPPVAPAAPPSGEVDVAGVILRSEGPDTGAADRGAADMVSRPDVELLARTLPYDVHPFYVRLQTQRPPQQGELPVVVAPPEVTEGPHLAYAVQWFLFAATAVVVYGALLGRDVRRRRAAPALGGSPA